jgi:xanthine dehydrogenase accessory factor
LVLLYWVAGEASFKVFNIERCNKHKDGLMMVQQVKVGIRGAGDLATGVAVRLWRSGFQVIMTEIDRPLTVRRRVAFSEAVFAGAVRVEDVIAQRANDAAEAGHMLTRNQIPVLVDPQAETLKQLSPDVLVDGIMAKRNLGTGLEDAPLVIGLGPGFTAGLHVHAVIETKRGHFLGRVLREGQAEADTGIPGAVMGYTGQRIVRAPDSGPFQSRLEIGALVQEGDCLGYVEAHPVPSPLTGVLRGLIHDGVEVRPGMKIGDVDPRGNQDACRTISDKALAIGGGVLEAILAWLSGRQKR